MRKQGLLILIVSLALLCPWGWAAADSPKDPDQAGVKPPLTQQEPQTAAGTTTTEPSQAQEDEEGGFPLRLQIFDRSKEPVAKPIP